MIPSIFGLDLDERWVVYRPLAGAVHLVEPPEGAPGEWAGRLIELLDDDDEPAPRPRSGPLSPVFLGLIPSRDCSLRCRYCGFAAGADGRSERLDTSLALAAVDWFAELCAREGRAEMIVELFGGEPLQQPALVEAIALRAWQRAGALGLHPELRVLTSGVTSEAVRDLLADLFGKVTLSIDGPQEVHDRLRPRSGGGGSFEAAARTAEVVGRGQADLALRACATSETTQMMERIAEGFIARFHPVEVSFEPLKPSAASRAAGLGPPEAADFVRAFLGAERLLERSGVRAIHATSQLEQRVVSFCPVGRDGVILGPGGVVSACYLLPRQWRRRGLDLELGRFHPRLGLDIDETRLSAVRELNVWNKPRCRDCFVQWHCAGGCHVDHTYPGCSQERDDLCWMTRAIAFARLLELLDLEEDARGFARAPFDPVERYTAPS